ncbi:MAG: hypothetical protein MAG715_01275 [Methanonatronarchaeales archaeon]|nr:hypothetical protein [Methanonatronarchaeales archaeon]
MEEVRVSGDPVEMLEQDLAGERDAIERYRKRIQQAESLREYTTAEALRGVLVVEQEHEMDLLDALGR